MSVTHETNVNFTCWDDTVRQYDISYPDAGSGFPLLILGHGFTGDKSSFATSVVERFVNYGFVVAKMTVRKDAGGLEIHDFYDLVNDIENNYAALLNGVRAYTGYSGGGGNGYSIFTKMPDLFDYVIVSFGMSDYEQWWWENTYRSTIESYIGGTPAEYPDRYAARNSLAAIENNKNGNIIIMHDASDSSVPVGHADDWKTAADTAGLTNYTYIRTTTSDTYRAIHGYPQVSTAGEPNIQFEVNESPAWITTVLASSGEDVAIPLSGSLLIPAFIHTGHFFIKLSNDDRATVNYDINGCSLEIVNDDTNNDITDVQIIIHNKFPSTDYQITRYNATTETTTTSTVTADANGDVEFTTTIDAGETVTWSATCLDAAKLVFKTDNAGSSNDDQATLCLRAGLTYNAKVDWKDGSEIESISSDVDIVHTFLGGSGTYEIEIIENVPGGFPSFHYEYGGDQLKIVDLSQFGSVTLSNMIRAFINCTNMDITATDGATANTGGVANWESAFSGCPIQNPPLFDMSGATSMFGMFGNNAVATAYPAYNTANVSNFRSVCYGNTNLSEIPDWDFSNMTNGTTAFYGTAVSSESYTLFLKDLAANNENTSVVLHGGSAKYYHTAVDDRAVLTSTRSWTITDGGVETEAFGTLSCTPSSGPVGTQITINNTGSGFYDTMIVKENTAGGQSFDDITVTAYNQLTATVPAGYEGQDIYVEGPGGDTQIISNAFTVLSGRGNKSFAMNYGFND